MNHSMRFSSPSAASIDAYVARKKRLLQEGLVLAAKAGKAEGDRRLLDNSASGRRYRSRRGAGHRPPSVAYPNAFGRHFNESGEWHTASAVGQPPHEDTGAARKGLQVFLNENRGPIFRTATGWEGEEAMIMRTLNDGSADGRIAPRPIMAYILEAGTAALLAHLKFGGSSLTEFSAGYSYTVWGAEAA